MNTLKHLLALGAITSCAFAGTFSMSVNGAFWIPSDIDDAGLGTTYFVYETNTYAPIVGVQCDAAHGTAAKLHGWFDFLINWSPSQPGDTPTTTMPLIEFQVDGELYGNAGTSAYIQATDGTKLLTNMTSLGNWQPIGVVYVQPDTDMLPATDGTGTYFGRLHVNTYDMFSTGADPNWGVAGLRYTFLNITPSG
jgi:hypothetical protein